VFSRVEVGCGVRRLDQCDRSGFADRGGFVFRLEPSHPQNRDSWNPHRVSEPYGGKLAGFDGSAECPRIDASEVGDLRHSQEQLAAYGVGQFLQAEADL
jgi:hypothetical protein